MAKGFNQHQAYYQMLILSHINITFLLPASIGTLLFDLNFTSCKVVGDYRHKAAKLGDFAERCNRL